MRTTRSVAGHSITLESGQRYRASRPMANQEGETFFVSIKLLDYSETGLGDYDLPPVVMPKTLRPVANVATIGPLDYDAANELINAFNNGVLSFDGRIWE